MLVTQGKKLASPYLGKIYRIGNNASDRRTTKIQGYELETMTLVKGIHVYSSKPRVNIWRLNQYCSLVRVFCLNKYFVAAGAGEMVYTRVHITEEDYQKALNSI